MANVNLNEIGIEKIYELLSEHGTIAETARHLGIPRTTLRDYIYRETRKNCTYKEIEKPVIYEPKEEVQYFILTSAQNNTKLHEGFWENLKSYAEFLGAEIFIGGFTYTLSFFDLDEKVNKYQYEPDIQEYIKTCRIHIGPKLSFCSEMNINPTAVNPLSGLEIYTNDRSGIFPHPKMHLLSVPTSKDDDTKLIMTTGCVTLPNYIKKKAGIKAEQHHIIGCVIVELLPNGDFFFRHIEAEDDGSFYDLKFRVENGKVKEEKDTVDVFVPGDIHIGQEDERIIDSVWFDENSLVKELNPKYQFLHDVSDFTARNHHRINDPHHLFEMHCQQRESVEEEIRKVAEFLENVSKLVKNTVVVDSNHDRALLRWLKEADYRNDPVNAIFFLTLQLEVYKNIQKGKWNFNVFEYACRRFFQLKDVLFLGEDESFVLHGIEFGMHGHYGANGSRASPRAFARMGKKSVTGHTHSLVRIDGHMTTGMFGKLKQNYNHGLSSWSHSCVIVYRNGKRTQMILRETNGGFTYCGSNWEKRNGKQAG